MMILIKIEMIKGKKGKTKLSQLESIQSVTTKQRKG